MRRFHPTLPALGSMVALLLAAPDARAQATEENTPAACRDGIDNDGDGHLDCSDYDCRSLRFCTPVRPENTLTACHDGIDNDQDGDLDCGDEDCRVLTFCALGQRPPPDPAAAEEPDEGDQEDTIEECRDGIDNDGDRRVDCRDPGCGHFVVCPEPRPGRSYPNESTEELCRDRSDNDADGLVDCRDPDCAVFMICSDEEVVELPEAEDEDIMCHDLADNDADGLVDCRDPDCATTAPCRTAPPPPPTEDTAPLCADGADNDADGLVDCDDPDCGIFGNCVPETAGEPEGGGPESWSGPESPASLRVTAAAPGAVVYVDGERRGEAPWQGAVPPGEHLVRVEAEGWRSAEERVVLGATGPPAEVSLEQVPAGQLDIGIFTLGLGVQAPMMMFGEASTMAAGGGVFQVRPLFAVVRSPIVLDIGLQLAGGYMASAEYPSIYRAGEELETSDADAFFNAKYFTVAAFVGVSIPLMVRERPVLALTLHTAHGISVNPVQYFADLAVGLSYFASDLVELRFELLGVQLWRVDAYTREPGADESERDLRDLWFVHLAPSVAVHLRF